MNNKNLETALMDLIAAITDITLGSVETIVIYDTGVSLINNWNDHNDDDRIDETAELENWRNINKF
jgi:hypothetical protein